MDRALLTPKWIVSHLLMALAVVLTVVLGFWQLGRLGDKRDRNAEIRARTDAPVVAITDLVTTADPIEVGEHVRFRVATATGTYLPADEVLVRNRTLDGAPGYWVLTPLRTESGAVVIVNRGWIPFEMGPGMSRAGTEAPEGVVMVSGLVHESVTAGTFQSNDEAGPLASLARVDLERYGAELTYPILPVYLQLEQQAPAAGDLPVMLDRPPLDEGPHLSYAVQWFVFGTIAAVGYPLMLFRLSGRGPRGTKPSDVPLEYLQESREPR
jgi:cytochrome oxidase assembly protein ShyY1